MIQKFDFLIIGSGIAGMSFALKVAHKGKVALICKTELEEANTYFAQGGVASVTNTLVDNFEKHIEDTMIAGDWLSDRAAVEKVVKEAPSQIKELISWGSISIKRKRRIRPSSGRRTFRISHPAPQGQHGCGNSRQPDTGCQTTPQHHYFRKAFRHRDSYATPPRSNCYAADSRHRMLRRLCARFENR